MCAHIFVHHVPMLAPVMFMHQACMHIYSVEFKCMCYGAYLSQACMFQYMCVHQTHMCTDALLYTVPVFATCRTGAVF